MANPSYVPNTDDDRTAMLAAIGVDRVEDLFASIPVSVRHPQLALAPGESELSLLRRLGDLAARNLAPASSLSFLGGGAYHHFIPAVVGHLQGRSEFYTAYTPYQPEVAQGTLQALFEFQSLICDLTSMEVTNAGMYDAATALAEAALMACRVTGRQRVVCLDTVSSHLLAVVRTYANGQGIGVAVTPADDPELDTDTACLLFQHPNGLGYFEEAGELAAAAHAVGALAVAVYHPISLGLLAPPGDYDADIAVGEGHMLGTATSFGGPYLGLFSCKQQYVRQMPSRIAGETHDTQGRVGYVLTLQTREQHIRRERATSNICTNTALMALGATIYLAALGPQGLREVAEACWHKAHYAHDHIAALPGYAPLSAGPFFNEFVVVTPRPAAALVDQLAAGGILAGIPSGNQLQVCVTELHTQADIDLLVDALHEATP